MAFPTIPTVAAGRVVTGVQANTTATRTFPSLTGLTKNSGDLLIAIIVAYQTSTINATFSSWGASFTEFRDSGTGTSVTTIAAAYKWSDGTETGTFTVTQAATVTGHVAMILLSIAGAHASTAPEGNTQATGTTAAADPAALAPSWGAEDTLWVAVGVCGETSTAGSFTGITAAPTNYSDFVDTGISSDVVGGCDGAVAFRQLNTSSEDVGGFTCDLSNARNGALTIAVRPAAETYVPRHAHVNHQDPGVFCKAHQAARRWTRGAHGMLLPGGYDWRTA